MQSISLEKFPIVKNDTDSFWENDENSWPRPYYLIINWRRTQVTVVELQPKFNYLFD